MCIRDRAIEENDFFMFTNKETDTLKKVTRLDLFEYPTVLKMEGFNVYGFIDSCSFDYKNIIDYKTGGIGKDEKYKDPDYTQLQIYALSLMQMHEVRVQNAWVEFITRDGNPFRGEALKVSPESIKKIEVDLSMKALDRVELDLIKTAKEIELFYQEYNESQEKLKL